MRARLGVSERRACRVLGQARSTQRHRPRPRPEEARLVLQMVALATAYGRYGYRRITALLRQAGWRVNAKRIERLWRQEGLKVPARQPRRGRLWLNEGSCIRLRPTSPNHVWAYDFVHERTHDGQALRLLTVVDEYTRECLAIRVARRLRSEDVLQQLTELFVARGTPAYLRSDNGPELTASAVREWLARVGVTTLFIEPGSPWGERIHRVVQRPAPRRAPRPRDLLDPGGGAGSSPSGGGRNTTTSDRIVRSATGRRLL